MIHTHEFIHESYSREVYNLSNKCVDLSAELYHLSRRNNLRVVYEKKPSQIGMKYFVVGILCKL